ncbi:MAG: hypothetical protein V7752_15040 [Halopseudomonas sp.]
MTDNDAPPTPQPETDIAASSSSVAAANTLTDKLVRIIAGTIVIFALLFLFNNYLTFWLKWPGVVEFMAHQQWLGFEALQQPLSESLVSQGWIQLLIYLAGLMIVALFVSMTPGRGLRVDAASLSALAAYIVRAAFWTVLIVGMADMLITFLRVENWLSALVGEQIANDLGRPKYRGANVHYPLIALSFVVALFSRSLGFVWLALLVVIAEFQIVLLGFIFSYEQAFMGDLVRFWYAALFLFASAHTLVCEGHVRVDVLYAHFSRRSKAWSNILGVLVLGLPLCWVILTLGMWGKSSSINSPLLSFEVSQSGYGMYIKYIMVAYLVVFSVSMIVQFCSSLLSNVADLRDEPGRKKPVLLFSE